MRSGQPEFAVGGFILGGFEVDRISLGSVGK
jgi:hypothetical protein